jgi:hypothetical protein
VHVKMDEGHARTGSVLQGRDEKAESAILC